jgi:hypothetical protein
MSVAPPGWHPDPSNPGGALRWWDGLNWTDHTHVAAPPAPAAPAKATLPAASTAWTSGSSTAGSSYLAPPPASAPAGAGALGQLSFVKRNRLSLIAIGVVAIYIVLALATHVVFLGIFPVIMCIRATKSKEPLAPLAIVGAVVAVAVALLALA